MYVNVTYQKWIYALHTWHCSKGHSLAVDDCRHLFRRLLLGPNAHDIHDAASHASEDVTHRRVPIHQNQISTPFNTCALQSERSSHLQARSPRHQPQYHLTSAKNWGWPIPEKFPLYPCQRRKVSCPTWNGSRSKADRGCSSGNLNILSTYLFFIPISLLVPIQSIHTFIIYSR